MQVGADHSNRLYAWPTSIAQPTRPPRLVYLDLLHWIALSKVVAGHPDGASTRPAWEACLNAKQEGRALFPIADSTVYEITRIQRYRQRRNLRLAIEALSDFQVVMARHLISRHEIEAVLDERFGPASTPIESMSYLDWGILRAFGRDGTLRVMHAEDGDVTAEVRAQWPGGADGLDSFVAEAQLTLQRSILDGPADEREAAALRAYGFDPRAGLDVAERRLQQEVDQVGVFDANPQWRAGRLRDVVAAREILIEINESLYAGLAIRGASLDDVAPDPEAARHLFDGMPSFDVAVTLKTAYHRDARHRWTVNDIHDIDALGSAVPYADIVVTDKAVAHQLNARGVATRCGTTVISRLDDLAALL